MNLLRVATWNMHGGVGLDGRFDAARIARVIAELDADVIALQEYGARDRAFDLRTALERAALAEAIVQPTLRKHGCDFGNIVLSRLPVLTSACHTLAVAGREPRNAIDLRLDSGNGTLRVITTHLGLRIAERREQIARLVAVITESREPTVLLGDFNVWRARGAFSALAAHFGHGRAPATFPAPCPLVALDRIWVAPATACIDLRVHKSRTARIASDHLPLIATLRLA